jgi:hypothetical protein
MCRNIGQEWSLLTFVLFQSVPPFHTRANLSLAVILPFDAIEYVGGWCTFHLPKNKCTGHSEKNIKQFEMRPTVEWLQGKVKGGSTRCGKARSLSRVNRARYARWPTAWRSVRLLSKHFTKPVVLYSGKTVRRKCNMRQIPARSAVSRLVQKLELTVSVCDKKKGTGQHAPRTMLLVYAKRCFRVRENLWHDVSSHSVSKEHQHTPLSDRIWSFILTKIQAQFTVANKQRRREFCQDFLHFVKQYPAILGYLWFSDRAHFHLDGFVNNQNMRLWASKNLHRVVETSSSL